MSVISDPVEETMKLSDTKQHFSKVVNRVASGEANIIVEKGGLPVAAIVSIDNYRQRTGTNDELQGEALYRMVEQGYIVDEDLSEDDQLDIAVYLVQIDRLHQRAQKLAASRVEALRTRGEEVSKRQILNHEVQALRDVRAQYLSSSSRKP